MVLMRLGTVRKLVQVLLKVSDKVLFKVCSALILSIERNEEEELTVTSNVIYDQPNYQTLDNQANFSQTCL